MMTEEEIREKREQVEETIQSHNCSTTLMREQIGFVKGLNYVLEEEGLR